MRAGKYLKNNKLHVTFAETSAETSEAGRRKAESEQKKG